MANLRPWSDVLSDMDAAGYDDAQKSQKRQEYLNAWLQTPEARAPKYQGLDVPPRVAKKMEMGGIDPEKTRPDPMAQAQEEADQRESDMGQLRRGWESVKHTAVEGLGPFAAGTEAVAGPIPLPELHQLAESYRKRKPFVARGPVEKGAEIVTQVATDPALWTAPIIGGTGALALSGAEHSIIRDLQAGEPVSAKMVAKAGGWAAFNALVGKVMEAGGSAAENLASKGFARDVSTEYLPRGVPGPVKPTVGAAGTVRTAATTAAKLSGEAIPLAASAVPEKAIQEGGKVPSPGEAWQTASEAAGPALATAGGFALMSK